MFNQTKESRIVFFSVVIVVFLTSCQNDEIDLSHSQDFSNILSFDSFEEFENELYKFLAKNQEERITWERQKGFNSLEMSAQRIYHQIDPSKFQSTDEIKQFVKENEKYLKLIKVENGEYELETCLNENPFRYLANHEGLFQVGDTLYKVFDDGTVSATSSDYMNLVNLNYDEAIENNQFHCISNKMHSMEKSSPLGCLLQDELRQTVGDERIRVLFYPSNTSLTSEVLMNYQIRGYHKVLLVWFQVERTLKCTIKVDCAYKTPDGVWAVHVFEYNNTGTLTTELSGYQRSYKICRLWQYNPSEVLGIYAYEAWAKQDYAELAKRTCNSY